MNFKWIFLAVAVVVGAVLIFMTSTGPRPVGELAIAQGMADEAVIVDVGSGRRLMSSPAGTNVHGVGMARGYLYAASYGENSASVIDAAGELIGTVDVGGKSHHIAVSPDERFVMLTVGSANAVAVIDATAVPHAFHDGASPLAAQIAVGEGPSYPLFTRDGRKAYVTNSASNSVSVIDMERLAVVKTIDVGKLPDHADVSPDGRFVYVTNGGSGDVSVLDVASDAVVATIPVGKGPHGVAASGQKVFVGNRGETTLSVIDIATNAVTGTIALGAVPEHITASADGRFLYIGVLADRSILVLDTSSKKIVKTLEIGTEVHQIALVNDY